jgi:hypothetical protein
MLVKLRPKKVDRNIGNDNFIKNHKENETEKEIINIAFEYITFSLRKPISENWKDNKKKICNLILIRKIVNSAKILDGCNAK